MGAWSRSLCSLDSVIKRWKSIFVIEMFNESLLSCLIDIYFEFYSSWYIM